MSERDSAELPSFQKAKATSSFGALVFKSLSVLLVLLAIFLGIYWAFGRLAFENLSKSDLYGQVMRGQVDVRRMAALEWATKLQNAETSEQSERLREYLPTEDEVAVLAQELTALESSMRPDSELIAGILGVLGHSYSVHAQEALQKFLQKPRQADWAKAQVQAVIGLSRRQPDDSQNLEIFKGLVSAQGDPSLRKAIAYVLGFHGEGEMDTETWTTKASILEELLRDETSDVRWNAAFSALRLHMDLAPANKVLLDLLGELSADVLVSNHSAERQNEWTNKRDTYLEGIKLTRTIERGTPLFDRVWVPLNQIAQGHPDLKIRQAAKESVKYQR